MSIVRVALLLASIGVLGAGCEGELLPTEDVGRVNKETPPDRFYCGDGSVQEGEECDGEDLGGNSCLTLELGDGTLRCGGGCTFDTALCLGANVCGNGISEAGEACDDGDTHVTDCPYGETACEVCSDECALVAGRPHYCGDGALDDLEECDGAAMRGDACTDHGYTGGDLGCADTCRFDFAACEGSVCGNGRVDGDEACDDGADNTEDCPYGAMSCQVCRPDCSFGVGMTYYCGNGRIDAEFGERCDGELVGDATCFEHGLGLGTPACEVLERDDGSRACLLDLSPCEGVASGGNRNRAGNDEGCATAGGGHTLSGVLLLVLGLVRARRRSCGVAHP